MTESEYERFKTINDQILQKEITVEAAVEQCADIDFMSFDIDQMKLVQDADWLPDDLSVKIMKGWIRCQDELLLKLRANLVLNPKISKEQLHKYIRSIAAPSSQNEKELIVENVFEKIGSAGGTRAYLNPLQYNLVYAETSDKASKSLHCLSMLFDMNEKTYFSSDPVKGASFTVVLPHFLKVKMSSYTLWSPNTGKENSGGPSNWVIYGSDNPKDFRDILDSQCGNNDLIASNANKTFPVNTEHFYRCFKFVLTGTNHLNNLTIHLQRFDLSGTLIINK